MITCPYCDSDHEAREPVSDGASFVKTCDYCGKAFKVDVWIDFNACEMEQRPPPMGFGPVSGGDYEDRARAIASRTGPNPEVCDTRSGGSASGELMDAGGAK